MKTIIASRRGFAVETALLLVVIFGGAGLFGAREFKHAVQDIKQQQACKDAVAAADKAKAETAAAVSLREQAERDLLDEKAARADLQARTVAMGRTIQRSTVEGVVAVDQLPASRQKDHLAARFGEIDDISLALFGSPTTSEAAQWKQTALNALAGQAAAQAELDQQKEEIARLKGQYAEAKSAQAAAEQKFDRSNKAANDAEVKAAKEVVKTNDSIRALNDKMRENGALSELFHAVLWILGAIAGFWVLGVLLKVFSFSLPKAGFLTHLADVSANFFHSALAPMAVYAETHAKGKMEEIVASTGAFISDLRRKEPDIATKVTAFLDTALSPEHQAKIRDSFLAVERNCAASAAELRARNASA